MVKWFDPDSWLYRKRYILGYLAIVVGFAGLLYVAGTQIPGGLTAEEEQAFVTSAKLDLQNIDTLAIADLPFHAVQRGIVELLGPSTFTFKLQSLIFALIAGIGAVLLLRRWFKPNIALLATVIMITTGQFVYVAQSGTPNIMYVMWPIWLLLTATMITTSPRHKRFWKLLFFVLVPLSLYTPLNAYLVVAIISAGLIHPHVRYVIRRMARLHLALLLGLSLVIVAPLVYLIVRQPQLTGQLLGLPADWPPDFAANAGTLVQQYFNFMNPQSGALMTPILGLGSMILIILGVWRLFKIRYTARSYTIVAWVLLLVPVLLVNPAHVAVAFVPLLILLAMGLEFLLRSWYGIFPRNPYARFVGLVPLVVLVGGLMLSGISRYFDGYRYDPATAANFSRDLTLLEQQVVSDRPTTLVVAASEREFYQAIVALDNQADSKLIVAMSVPVGHQGRLAATRAVHDRVGYPIDRIITVGTSADADRFYIYKTK